MDRDVGVFIGEALENRKVQVRDSFGRCVVCRVLCV